MRAGAASRRHHAHTFARSPAAARPMSSCTQAASNLALTAHTGSGRP